STSVWSGAGRSTRTGSAGGATSDGSRPSTICVRLRASTGGAIGADVVTTVSRAAATAAARSRVRRGSGRAAAAAASTGAGGTPTSGSIVENASRSPATTANAGVASTQFASTVSGVTLRIHEAAVLAGFAVCTITPTPTTVQGTNAS